MFAKNDSVRGAAMAALRERLGNDAVLDREEQLDHYGRTTLPSAPLPAAVVLGKTKNDVVACVEIAKQFGLHLYPISGGKNWGLGSACPTTEGQIVLDLSGMNRILEVNEELGYAVLEPGVTQGQLYQHLKDKNIDLWLDATGAGPDATIIGNLMERGYGHTPNGDRFHNSCAYEVILADGTILETGWAHNKESRVSNLSKTGLGPSIDGLFTQSNLGIVVRATIWLIPKPECFTAYAFRLESQDDLCATIDALRPLRSLGVINSVVHLANDYRVISSHRRFPHDQLSGEDALPESIRSKFREELGLGKWNVLGGIYGTKASVAGVRKSLKKSLKRITRPIFIDDKKLSLFDFVYRYSSWVPPVKKLKAKVESGRSAISLLKGEPVRDHLGGSGWRSKLTWEQKPTDPLDRNDGVIWITPLVPLTSSACNEFLNLIEPIFERHGFEPLLTFVMISERVMCCPTTICYNREDESETVRANACYQDLLKHSMNHGFPPYRAGIQTITSLANNDPYWNFVARLKGELDPKKLIAPGRYARS
ncbi:MAG: FAD-binding oxidoreductase [Planctomycetales bacterium]|nr:FAD-binding oxidoreductase [Planctomycetales bacterium]